MEGASGGREGKVSEVSGRERRNEERRREERTLFASSAFSSHFARKRAHQNAVLKCIIRPKIFLNNSYFSIICTSFLILKLMFCSNDLIIAM